MKLRRLAQILTAFLAAVLSLFAPITQAVVKAKNDVQVAVASALPTLFSLFGIGSTGPPQSPDIAPGPEATPPVPPGEVFINKLNVLNSNVGLVQTSASINFLGGWAYDTRNYLRITQSAPNNPTFVDGIATDSTGAIHVYDASAGLPADTRWVNGLPLTSSGQLCVAFN